ncbi:MAG TPA: hypothetical protein VFG52_06820, partial [Xanthomonadales bacterium]|nr:hypothetical protein [Xanthomonadales bacterium]
MNTTVADTCHCIVRHPDKAKFLVVKHEEEDWSPPVLMFPPGTVDENAGLVNQGMQDKYGLKTRMLRSIMHLPNYHCIELELAHVQSSKKLEAVWVDKAEYMSTRTPPGDIADPFELWFDEQESGQPVANRPPFQQPGWFNKADHWIHFQLDSLGFQVTGSVQQVQQSMNLECMLRAPTNQGWAYFKTSQEAPPGEAALTDALARRWPGAVRQPLAIDAGRNWMLNRELPEHATDIDASMLPEFARSLAKLQVETAVDPDQWKAMGCRQASLEDLAIFCNQPEPHKALLQEGGGGLSEEEWDLLPEALQPVAAA